MRLACREDFEEPGGLYWNPTYSDYSYFTQRAESLVPFYVGKRVLIVGAGWGFTVAHARGRGVLAFGLELSQYALDRGAEECPAAVQFMVKGDATTADGYEAAVQAAGGRFDLAITEDVLPMLTVPEIKAVVDLVPSYADKVVHWVTPLAPGQDPHPSIPTTLDAAGWKALLGSAPLKIVG